MRYKFLELWYNFRSFMYRKIDDLKCKNGHHIVYSKAFPFNDPDTPMSTWKRPYTYLYRFCPRCGDIVNKGLSDDYFLGAEK